MLSSADLSSECEQLTLKARSSGLAVDHRVVLHRLTGIESTTAHASTRSDVSDAEPSLGESVECRLASLDPLSESIVAQLLYRVTGNPARFLS